MASSTHIVCRFCACAVQTKYYTPLFSPGGLNKHLPSRMVSTYKLYRFSLLLLQDDVTALTEDRAYDAAASNARTAIVAETETDASDVRLRNVLRSSLPKITNTQILGTSGTDYTQRRSDRK